MTTLLPVSALYLTPSLSLLAEPPTKNYNELSQRLKGITPATTWKLIDQVKLPFKTFHCQGMTRINDEYWVSSVEIAYKPDGKPDRTNGKGHLFHINPTGKLLADIPIGEGAIFHPSGIDFDGKYIWIAAAEYRPDSNAIVYRFDPTAMRLQEMFRWPDHLGAICCNKSDNTLHAISWGSRKRYSWPLDKNGHVPQQSLSASKSILNTSFYIDYQDNQYLGGDEVLYTGLSAFKKADGSVFALGGLEIVDLRLRLPVHQSPVQQWSPATGDIITKNPSCFELTAASSLRAYFIPDDNDSSIFIYDIL